MEANLKKPKKKFKCIKKIGEGSFGKVYAAISFLSYEHVAIKKEFNQIQASQLQEESRVLQAVTKSPGFPIFKYFGFEGSHMILATNLMGKNLKTLFKLCKHRFSLKTTLMIADQILGELQFLHQCHYIHRDIKPENFVVGRKLFNNQICMIDFGLCKLYRDPISHAHMPLRENKPLIGTVRFASINSHFGYEQSRRDDLESLAYMLIYFSKGSLPWQKIHSHDNKLEKIAEKKKEIPLEQLCKDLPSEFSQFLTSVRNLKFDEQPNYSEYRSLFRELFIREGYIFDYHYDWIDIHLEHYLSSNELKQNHIQNEEPLFHDINNISFSSSQKLSSELPTLKIHKTRCTKSSNQMPSHFFLSNNIPKITAHKNISCNKCNHPSWIQQSILYL